MEYGLTGLSRTLVQFVDPTARWAEDHFGEVDAGQRRYEGTQMPK